MQTKFYGDALNSGKRSALRTAARYAMSNLKSDVYFYMVNGVGSDIANPYDSESKEYQELETFYEKNGSFLDYFHSAEYVLCENSDNREGFLKVAIDIEGKEALRMYFNLGESKAEKIEYLYTDFNIAVSFSITSEGWAQWFADRLVGSGIVEEAMEKAEGVKVN